MRRLRFFLLGALVVLMAGCPSQSKSTNTQSDSLPDLAARKNFLKRYFSLPSEVDDLAFHVVYNDNSGGLAPGPSDWDIQILARVKPDDISAWRGTLQPQVATIETDDTWRKNLKGHWDLDSANAKYYGSPQNILVVFPESGIVARRVFTF